MGAGGEGKCTLAEETALAEGGSVVGGFLGRLRNRNEIRVFGERVRVPNENENVALAAEGKMTWRKEGKVYVWRITGKLFLSPKKKLWYQNKKRTGGEAETEMESRQRLEGPMDRLP